jgi:hypothetical protein
VRLDSNDYSVHPAVIGRRAEVVADLEQVQMWCDGRLVAEHARCWARHRTLSDPAHLAAAAQLRQPEAGAPGTSASHGSEEVGLRLLTDYDHVFSLDDSEVA